MSSLSFIFIYFLSFMTHKILRKFSNKGLLFTYRNSMHNYIICCKSSLNTTPTCCRMSSISRAKNRLSSCGILGLSSKPEASTINNSKPTYVCNCNCKKQTCCNTFVNFVDFVTHSCCSFRIKRRRWQRKLFNSCRCY